MSDDEPRPKRVYPPKVRALTQEQIAADPTRHGYYGGRNKERLLCGNRVVKGTTTCRVHPGGQRSTPQLKREGGIRMELAKWTLNDAQLLSPQEVEEKFLQLISQTAARIDLYSTRLQRSYEAAERLQQALAAEELIAVDPADRGDRPPHPDVQAAREDLRRIFTSGGLAALIGYKYDATKDGDIYAVEEATRGLVKLEMEERKFFGDLCAKAIAAGIAERHVRVAEQMGAQFAAQVSTMFTAVIAAMAANPDQSAAGHGELLRQLEALSGGATAPRVIEGVARA